MRKFAIVTIGSLLLLLTGLGLGELFARAALLALGYPLTMERPQRTEFQAWGAWGLPGSEGRMSSECYSVSYRFNSYGARDRERSLTGEGRFIFLGDSFTEGFGVEEENRLSNQLEVLTGREVMNFGSSGNFGPLQYHILYQGLAKRYEHDGLIVGFLPDNDFTDNDPAYWAAPALHSSRLRHRPYYDINSETNQLTWKYGVFGESVPRLDFDENTSHGYSWIFGGLKFSRIRHHSSLAYMVSIVANAMTNSAPPNAKESQYFSSNVNQIAATRIIFGELAKAAGERRKILVVFARNSDIAAQKMNGMRASHEVEGLLRDLVAQGWEVFDTSQLPEVNALDDLSLGCNQHWNDAAHAATARAIAPSLQR